jgi:hypothetical protein
MEELPDSPGKPSRERCLQQHVRGGEVVWYLACMRHRTCLLLFALFFFTYIYSHPFYISNEAGGHKTRLFSLMAVVLEGRFTIDTNQGDTNDKALYNGHYYSEKAPVTTLLALPAFLLSFPVIRAFGTSIQQPLGWGIASWMTTGGSVALITALSAMAFFSLFHHIVGRKIALLVTFAFYLGSSPFMYVTQLYDHTVELSLIVFALWGILMPLKTRGRRGWLHTPLGRDVIVGLSMGFAAANEYTAAVAVLGLAVLVLLSWGWKRAIRIYLLAAIPALLLPLNNWILFDSPFVIPYRYSFHYDMHHSQGLMGIRFLPSWEKVAFFLFHERKGILTWSPFLFLVPMGLKDYFVHFRKLFFVSLVVVILQVILIGSYMGMSGPSIGARYLACIVPFLMIPFALACKKFPRIGASLVLLSILLVYTAVLVDPNLPPPIRVAPIFSEYFHRVVSGDFNPNLGTVLSLPPHLSFSLPLLAAAMVFFILWRLKEDRGSACR